MRYLIIFVLLTMGCIDCEVIVNGIIPDMAKSDLIINEVPNESAPHQGNLPMMFDERGCGWDDPGCGQPTPGQLNPSINPNPNPER